MARHDGTDWVQVEKKGDLVGLVDFGKIGWGGKGLRNPAVSGATSIYINNFPMNWS